MLSRINPRKPNSATLIKDFHNNFSLEDQGISIEFILIDNTMQESYPETGVSAMTAYIQRWGVRDMTAKITRGSQDQASFQINIGNWTGGIGTGTPAVDTTAKTFGSYDSLFTTEGLVGGSTLSDSDDHTRKDPKSGPNSAITAGPSGPSLPVSAPHSTNTASGGAGPGLPASGPKSIDTGRHAASIGLPLSAADSSNPASAAAGASLPRSASQSTNIASDNEDNAAGAVAGAGGAARAGGAAGAGAGAAGAGAAAGLGQPAEAEVLEETPVVTAGREMEMERESKTKRTMTRGRSSRTLSIFNIQRPLLQRHTSQQLPIQHLKSRQLRPARHVLAVMNLGMFLKPLTLPSWITVIGAMPMILKI